MLRGHSMENISIVHTAYFQHLKISNHEVVTTYWPQTLGHSNLVE